MTVTPLDQANKVHLTYYAPDNPSLTMLSNLCNPSMIPVTFKILVIFDWKKYWDADYGVKLSNRSTLPLHKRVQFVHYFEEARKEAVESFLTDLYFLVIAVIGILATYLAIMRIHAYGLILGSAVVIYDSRRNTLKRHRDLFQALL